MNVQLIKPGTNIVELDYVNLIRQKRMYSLIDMYIVSKLSSLYKFDINVLKLINQLVSNMNINQYMDDINNENLYILKMQITIIINIINGYLNLEKLSRDQEIKLSIYIDNIINELK